MTDINPYAMAEPLRDPSSQPKFGVWKHMKTGNLYEIVGFGLVEKTLTPSVIYRQHSAVIGYSSLWVRPCEEFFDGRFVRQN